jgi:hypothetical protein
MAVLPEGYSCVRFRTRDRHCVRFEKVHSLRQITALKHPGLESTCRITQGEAALTHSVTWAAVIGLVVFHDARRSWRKDTRREMCNEGRIEHIITTQRYRAIVYNPGSKPFGEQPDQIICEELG